MRSGLGISGYGLASMVWGLGFSDGLGFGASVRFNAAAFRKRIEVHSNEALDAVARLTP